MSRLDRTRPVHDPRVLRAISHPVRNRILSELEASGALRAADVAQLLDLPANQASFHLRQLAKYGLVEPAPELARDRRDRVWRLAEPGGLSVDLGELEKSPGGAAAVSVFRRNSAAWAHGVVDRAFGGEKEEGSVQIVTSQAIRLSKEEARQVAGELDDVVDRWAKRGQAESCAGDAVAEARRTYLFFQVVQPYPDVVGPAAD